MFTDMRPTTLRPTGRRPMCSTGFTLVELLVVIGIIALLLSVLLPALGKARSTAQRAACLSNQRQIVLAILMYAGDNKGTLPGPAFPMVLDPLTTNPQPGQPVGQQLNGIPVSTLSVWTGSINYETMQMSSTYLLQKYLGGIQSRNVWFCPASDAVRNAPIYSGPYAGKVPGFGYLLNNYTCAYGFPMASPNYLFGAYSAIGTGSPKVQAFDRVPKKLNNITASVDGIQNAIFDPNESNYTNTVHDLTKVWITTDFDGRNGVDTVSGSFNITPGATTTATKNTYPYQPAHRVSSAMPNGLGRVFSYLDGHGEFRLFGDWPGGNTGRN